MKQRNITEQRELSLSKSAKKHIISAISVASLCLGVTNNAIANTIHSGDIQEHTSPESEKGVEIDIRSEKALNQEEFIPAFSLQISNGADTLLGGIDLDLSHLNKDKPYTSLELIFLTYKHRFANLFPGMQIAGAIGIQDTLSTASPFSVAKTGASILLEQEVGQFRFGANTGIAYHNGYKSLFPSTTLYSTYKAGDYTVALEGFADLPLQRLKEEVKEEILHTKTEATLSSLSPEESLSALFGARLFFQKKFSEQLQFDINASYFGSSRKNMHFQLGMGMVLHFGQENEERNKKD